MKPQNQSQKHKSETKKKLLVLVKPPWEYQKASKIDKCKLGLLDSTSEDNSKDACHFKPLSTVLDVKHNLRFQLI